MRAWQVTGVGDPRKVVELTEQASVPEVMVGPPQLAQVEVHCASLGLPDVLMCRDQYVLAPPRPFTPGQELVGVVTDALEGSPLSVGQRVMGVSGFFVGAGAFADRALVVEDTTFAVPDGMSDEDAAGFVIPYHTAWVGLVQRAAIVPGETVLVLGAAGGTGSAAVLLAKARGARVVAVAGGAERVDFVRSLGADVVIDRRDGPIAPAVREATDGKGAAVVYDTVGGAAAQDAMQCIASEGRFVLVGYASGSWAPLDAPHMVQHNYSVLGIIPSGYDRDFKLKAQAELEDHLREGQLRVPVGSVRPFEELPEALEDLDTGRVLGKSVVRIRS